MRIEAATRGTSKCTVRATDGRIVELTRLADHRAWNTERPPADHHRSHRSLGIEA